MGSLPRRCKLAVAREPLVHTLPRATASPSSRVQRGGGMLDAPTLRQAGRLQRVDEAPPPRDLHGVGWELLLLMIVVDMGRRTLLGRDAVCVQCVVAGFVDIVVDDMGRRILLGCCVRAACR
eukprot:scaffold39558_cov56-Phaeocystis_antarctica.AAC.2